MLKKSNERGSLILSGYDKKVLNQLKELNQASIIATQKISGQFKDLLDKKLISEIPVSNDKNIYHLTLKGYRVLSKMQREYVINQRYNQKADTIRTWIMYSEIIPFSVMMYLILDAPKISWLVNLVNTNPIISVIVMLVIIGALIFGLGSTVEPFLLWKNNKKRYQKLNTVK